MARALCLVGQRTAQEKKSLLGEEIHQFPSPRRVNPSIRRKRLDPRFVELAVVQDLVVVELNVPTNYTLDYTLNGVVASSDGLCLVNVVHTPHAPRNSAFPV